MGVNNRGGSHGVVQIYALPSQGIFELTTAGVGIGFCGAHLRSQDSTLYVIGSADGPGCASIDSSCTSTSNINTPETCLSPVQTFTLPDLGRQSSSSYCAASAYPGSGPNVLLTSATADDVYFGPSSPTI